MRDRTYLIVVVLVFLACPVAVLAADLEAKRAGYDFFENKIRPLFVQRCFACHAGEKREGELRLDRRDHLLQGGRSGRAILPGDPTGSLLIRVVRRIDKDLQMPPDEKDQLTAAEIQDLDAWVKMGAPYPGEDSADVAVKPKFDLATARKFWSLQPLCEPATSNGFVPSIDQFVQAKLQAAGMKPTAPAEKRDLLRRVTYDLTGLPPTLSEVDAFLHDTSGDAYAKVVERLLNSPQYGVHWARHWLDVARYGDTRWVGAGEDRRWPFAYTYRDWVVQALNEDLPYDRFVTLQLAADQTPDARPADQAALGFLTLGRWFAGALPDVIDDQIDVVTRGLLGLSVQCARCHDHKFDPISTQDYYSLYGLFAAARMPVEGSGLMADLPAVTPRPVDAAFELEIAQLRNELDTLIKTRLEAVRKEFRDPEKTYQYFLAAASQLPKTDQEMRAFAKSQGLDDRLMNRWYRYLKNTARNPHPVFAPLHALAAVPETEFAAQVSAVLEKEKAGKLNPLVVKILDPAPESLAAMVRRYVDLIMRYDSEKVWPDADQEGLRQVLRGNDCPAQVNTSELGQFLSTDDLQRLTEIRRAMLAKVVTLSDHADQYLCFQHEAQPLQTEIQEFLQQRRAAFDAERQSAEKIAAYLLAAREGDGLPDGKIRAIAKSRELSDKWLTRWMAYLQKAADQNDPLFAAWRIYAAAKEADFKEQAQQLAERAQQASTYKEIAGLFAVPPESLADVAKRYAELLVRCDRTEPFSDADQEVIRAALAAANFPLRLSPDDLFDLMAQKDRDELKNKEVKLARMYLDTPGALPRAMALRDSSRGYSQRVFVRGNSSVLGEPAHGGFLQVLSPAETKPFTPGRGRWELAQAIVDRTNPLTARVIVNRVWQWHFGAGLVATPSDFGTRGSAPSHPELLDWLTNQFIADGWSLKKLHRRILLSNTWRQSSQDNPAYRAVDPDNRWLWRMQRRRLGFEELRDSVLVAAGRLDSSLDGRPSDLAKSVVRRRTLYGAVDRVTLPGFYRYFDFPGADAHVPERHETIVAQQALYLMNNGFPMEQAAFAARRASGDSAGETAERIERLYRQMLTRSPTKEELALGLDFIQAAATETSTANSDATDKSATASDAWRYGWGSYDAGSKRVAQFEPFPFFGNNQFKGGPQENDPTLGRMQLNSRGGYAGPNASMAVIRRWVAPHSGRVSITGQLVSQINPTQPLGGGVRGRIVSSRQGELGVWLVFGTEEPTNLADVVVEAGDTIDFVTDGRGHDMHTTFQWSPVLKMDVDADTKTESANKPMNLVWDANKDFPKKSPELALPKFGVWERYAQVLLETNEFTFLD